MLLGTVFPSASFVSYRGQAIEDRGWFAELLVTGDPVKVLQRYQTQAAAVGIPTRADAATACLPRGIGDLVDCYVYDSEDGAAVFRRGLSMNLRRGSTPHATSNLTVRYEDPVPAFGDESLHQSPDFHPAPGFTDDVPMVPLPEKWPSLPSEGERFGGRFIPGEPGVRLVRGSELVAPPLESECAGFKAVLRVWSKPRKVVAEYTKQYVKQFETGGIEEPSHESVTSTAARPLSKCSTLVRVVVLSWSPRWSAEVNPRTW